MFECRMPKPGVDQFSSSFLEAHSTVPSNRENRYFIRLDVVSIGQIVLRVSAFYLLNWLSNRPDVLFFIFIQQEDTDTNSGNRTSNF